MSALPTYSISGTLTGSGVIGSTVTLGGAAESTTLADESGNYTFNGVINGTYTVTPIKDGFDFAPLSQSVE